MMTVAYTCAKCDHKQVVHHEAHPFIPTGWDRVTLESGEAHLLCPPCIADYWEWINERAYFKDPRP